MLPYTTRGRATDAKDSQELKRSCTYDLLSVVEHVGEIDTGHYVTYSRVGDQVSYTAVMLLCDDANIYNSGFRLTTIESN